MGWIDHLIDQETIWSMFVWRDSLLNILNRWKQYSSKLHIHPTTRPCLPVIIFQGKDLSYINPHSFMAIKPLPYDSKQDPSTSAASPCHPLHPIPIIYHSHRSPPKWMVFSPKWMGFNMCYTPWPTCCHRASPSARNTALGTKRPGASISGVRPKAKPKSTRKSRPSRPRRCGTDFTDIGR